jgi:hypothetical protein
MDTSSKFEVLLGAVALASTVVILLISYSWAYPSYYPGTFRLSLEGSPEPIRTLAILVLIVAALGVIQGFRASFSEMALGLLIVVWMALIVGWFFPEGSYTYLEHVDVVFTHASLLLYGSIGIALEIAMIAHGIYRGKKSEEYEPEQTR